MDDANRGYKRTRIAKFGADIAMVFAAKFYQTQINGFQPVLREPPGGVSTGGGRQPLQHLVLQPSGDGGIVLTIGSVNMVQKTAKLRSYRCLQTMYAQRFIGATVPIQPELYEDLFQRMLQFLRQQGLHVEVVEVAPAMDVGSRRPSPANDALLRVWQWGMLLVVFVASVAAIVAWFATRQ
jgi:hypothetical protein